MNFTILRVRSKRPFLLGLILQSLAQLDRGDLPFENLKLRIIREREIGGSPGGDVLRNSTPWLISKMYRFPWSGLIDKVSPERPPQSWQWVSHVIWILKFDILYLHFNATLSIDSTPST